MYPSSVSNYSGIFVHEQVKALINLGINVEVISPMPYSPKFLSLFSKKWKLISQIPKTEVIEGVKVHRPKFLAIPDGKLKQYWGFIYAFFSSSVIMKIMQTKQIDLFHVHGTLPDDHAVAILSKKFGIPFVVTVHGASVYFVSKTQKHLKQSLNAKRKSAAIICVSDVLQKKMEALIGANYGGKYYTIYNGYKNSNVIVAKKKSDEFVILFVGGIIEQKGIRYLIKAFSKINEKYGNTRLVIVGEGVLLNEIKYLVKQFGLQKSITFKGGLSPDKTLMEYSNSNVFVLPSWNEGFGVVYLEAMSQSIPIVGSKGFGISDIVIDGKNGFLVEPRNIAELYNKLEILINNEKLRLEMGQMGNKTIRELTWEKNAIEYNKVYKMILQKNKN